MPGANAGLGWLHLVELMLRQRLLVVLIALPIGLAAIIYGGWVFTLLIAFILGFAAWEYVNICNAAGLRPARYLVVAGVLILLAVRSWRGCDWDAPLLAGFSL